MVAFNQFNIHTIFYQGLIDQLQMKLRSFKKQIEEVEEIAALNLAKFRQTQGNLGEAEQRADLNEQALAKIKAHDRAASMGPVVGYPFHQTIKFHNFQISVKICEM